MGRCVASRHLWRQTSIALDVMICGCYRCLGVTRRHWPTYRIEVGAGFMDVISWPDPSYADRILYPPSHARQRRIISAFVLTHLGQPFHLCQINASAQRKRDAT